MSFRLHFSKGIMGISRCGGRVFSSTGFSLWILVLARIKPHRLKPVLLKASPECERVIIPITTSNITVPRRDVDSPGDLRKTTGLPRRPMRPDALLE
jgi:hypothetical protein